MKSKKAKEFIERVKDVECVKDINGLERRFKLLSYDNSIEAVELAEEEMIEAAIDSFMFHCPLRTDDMCDLDDREPMYNKGCNKNCGIIQGFANSLNQ